MVAAGEDRAGVGAAVEDRAGLRGRVVERRGGGPVAGDAGDGDPLARPVRRPPAGRAGRRAATRPAALDPARSGRGRRGRHAGADPAERHALVADLDGGAHRAVAARRSGGSGGSSSSSRTCRTSSSCPPTRSSWTRSSTWSGSTTTRPRRGGVVRGREVRDAGPGPLPAGAADDARHAASGAPTTTSGTAPPACSPRSTSPTAA